MIFRKLYTSCTDNRNYVSWYDASLPYAMSGLSSPDASILLRDQELHFNAMQQPDTISENGYSAVFSYYGDKTRAEMTVSGPNGYSLHCDYYDQQYNCFSMTAGGVMQHKSVLWLGGTPYTAPAALLKDYGNSSWQVVYVLRDNLGSITHVVDSTGAVLQKMGYTAWGQLRDPQTGAVYGADNQPELLLGRGYTGHEHLPWFGLINMNARLYDPAVGLFLSPDPIVQAPDNTQNFNRYSYCLNNPMRYTDPSGQMKAIVYNDLNELGEFIAINCYLDDITVICTRTDSSNGTPSFDVTSYWLNTNFQYFTTYSGSRVPFLEGYSYNYNDSQSEELSKILNATSSTLSYLSYLLKDCKTTYAFVFNEKSQYPVIKVSKSGSKWYGGSKTHSVAKLGGILNLGSKIISGVSLYNDYMDAKTAFQCHDYDKVLKYGVDCVIDGISFFPGPIPILIGVTWNLTKDDLWDYLESESNGSIIPTELVDQYLYGR